MSRKHHLTKSEQRRADRRSKNKRNRLIIGSIALVALVAVITILLFNTFVKATPAADTGSTITVEDAYSEYKTGTFLLDVREQSEWDAFHIPDTTWIPLGDLESRVDELPADQRIIVVCNSGNRSDQGRDTLLENGFTDVTSMDGGVSAWSDAGYPIEGVRP